MPPETAQSLHDIKCAAERIARFVGGRSYDDYLNDELLRSGVERQVEIIGEAMTRLIKRDHNMAEKISDFRKIAGFRNALIHGYDSIDNDTSWGIITKKLPVLLVEVTRLLAE
jgi:uncharacterized protein with HEPN domain